MSRTEDDVQPLRNRATAALRGFYARYPAGALRTSVLQVGEALVVRAAVYRTDADRRPAATALSAWSMADALPDRDVALRLAESRAIQAALGYLGFDEPSIDILPVESIVEPPKPALPSVAPPRSDDPYAATGYAARRRLRAAPIVASDAPMREPAPAFVPLALREHVTDFDALIVAAQRIGLRAARARRWRARLHAIADDTSATRVALEHAERRLRRWVARGEPL